MRRPVDASRVATLTRGRSLAGLGAWLGTGVLVMAIFAPPVLAQSSNSN